MKTRLTRLAYRMERLWDRIDRSDPSDAQFVEPYIGYATADARIVRGRVLAKPPKARAEKEPTTWRNMKAMGQLFLSDEVAGVEVTAEGVTALSDEEGYVSLRLPGRGDPGWHAVTVHLAGHEEGFDLPVFVPHPDAHRGVISDIDDTVMLTGAWSLKRNLWTTMTGTVASRHVFPDAVALLSRLAQEDQRNPVFYVSSSPWNMHGFLGMVFARNGLPRGPAFLRDFGLDRDRFIKGAHGDHKGEAIDTVFTANPGLPFVLVGDTGQHDAHVYADAVKRHPGRVERVILRKAGKDVAPAVEQAVAAIKDQGIPAAVVQDYRDVLAELD